MIVPVAVQELFDARNAESTRIEYKSGFNPAPIIRTICAFANDIDNTGGGYIIIGVEEENGRPELPLKGIPENEVDSIMKKLMEYCRFIEPLYEPVVEPVKYADPSDGCSKNLILIWAPAGYGRPYRTLKDVTKKSGTKEFYIRKFSSSVVASPNEEKELFYVSSSIPFDDRVCLPSTVDDLDIDIIRKFLIESGSRLLKDGQTRDMLDLARNMRIVSGSPENEKPLNVGILMFSSDPQKYFPYARIEIVIIPDERGTNMIEQTFTGTLQCQLRGALQFISTSVIKEAVIKHHDRAEAERFFNYPYEAVEELLTNAVYHRSYQEHEPVTVRIENDFMEITSVPGFDRSITDEDIRKLKLRGIRYRNRRIGDFLKELHLTEGRNTGFPNAFSALRANGSDLPEFIMNEERDYLRVKIPVHPYFASSGNARDDKQYLQRIVDALQKEPLTLTSLARAMGYKGISRKLKSGTETLLKERRIETFIKDGQIRYRNVF